MPALINLKASGLWTSPNQLETPEGSLSIGSNVIIRRDGVIESRRGFKLYGTQTATFIKQLFTYKERLLRHFGSTLQFDTEVLNADEESIFSSFSGSFLEVETGLRIKSIESNGNLYFTTAEGIKKISANSASQLTTASGFITNAGGVKAINGTARINLQLGNSTGFLPEDSAVAYRIVWGITDANNNQVLGTPSERIVLYNPLMGFLIPDFDRILGALDDITDNTTTAFIGDGNYVSTLFLDSTASPTDLQTNIIALAEKIDTDIFVAGSAAQPIDIQGGASVADVTSNVATITKDAGGNFNDYFEPGSKIFLNGFTGTAAVLNGPQTVVTATATQITFNITTGNFNQAPIAAGSEIHSYEYRNTIANISYNNATFDLNTITIDNPATHDQLKILQTALSQIISRLQTEPVTIISGTNQTNFITPLDVTTSTNVFLNINIPQDVTANHYLQIYRSDIAQATGTTVLSDLTPNDEMQLVYEAFPTAAELSAGFMIVEDIVVDDFAGANLYTNPSTGEGILQANDVPPLSKDINRFRNVIFYANTQTRQRLNLSLLGVQNFKAGNITLVSAGNPATITTDVDHELTTGQIVYINGTGIAAIDGQTWPVTVLTDTTYTIPVSGAPGSTTGYWSNSMVAIISETNTQQYYFVKGEPEVRTVTFGAAEGAANTLEQGANPATNFTIDSANDNAKFYVWFSNGTTLAPTSIEIPDIAERTEIEVPFLNADLNSEVAVKARNKINVTAVTYFTAEVGTTPNSHVLTITNAMDGIATDSVASVSTGITLSTTQQGRGENATLNEVLLSTSISPAQGVDETARSFQNVINKNNSEDLYIYYLSGLSDVPGKMLLEGRALSSPEFCLLANNFDTGDSFDPPITPDPEVTITNTAANPTVVTATAHGLVSGDNVLIAFSNSTPLINGKFLVTFLTANTFSIPVNVTTAGTSGVMINEANAVCSENEQKPNRIYFSKFQQPEAVPLVNYFDVGSEEKAILRIFPLRDSLFVFKEDGVFRISGELAPFNLAAFDTSCKLIAADSLGLLNNQIYGWTDSGIQVISESGIDIVSRPIDVDILKLASLNYTNFPTVTWGVGYTSDNSYTVYTNLLTTDEVATIGYRYSNLTQSWTTIDKSTRCGLINDKDDRMYMGAGDVNFIEQERKSFDRTDYAEREIRTNINNNSFFDNGARIKLPSVDNMEIGDVLFQEQFVSVVNFNALLLKLDIDVGIAQVPILSITTGASPTITVKNFVFAPADVNTVTDTITVPAHGFVDGEKIRFVSTGTLPAPLVANEDYYILNSTTNTFQLTTIRNGTLINLTTTGVGSHRVFKFHNLVAGESVQLSSTNSDPVVDGVFLVDSVPTGYQFVITPLAPITTAGTSGLARYSYSENQTMVGGNNIRLKLEALVQKLDTDPGTQFANYFDIIDSKSGTIITNSAANPSVITLYNQNFAPADVSIGTDTINLAGHTFVSNDQVTFTSTGTLPGGIVAGVTYFIKNPVAGVSVQLSLSPSTSTVVLVDLTSIGTGTHTIKLSHELQNDRLVSIIGTNSLPIIDGNRIITVVNANQFSVPVSVQISGSSGTYSTLTASYQDLLACFNAIVNQLNVDPGPIFNNYVILEDSVQIEALITSVNQFTNEITLAPAINFLVGPVKVFRAIQTEFQYTPITMGDSLGWKHLTNFTMMFESKAFTNAVVSFASDLLPEFIPVPFEGDGNGIFGHKVNFGDAFFGGGSHGAPFRTIFPRTAMRCRYSLIRYDHRIAREKWSCFGISIDGSISQSNRAYRR